jgi:hypothetical protein
MSGDNQIDTRLQAARDGALIVSYMHQFYSYAYSARDPWQLETCHVSLTIEMISSFLWLHWREVDPVDGEVYYRMEPIESAHLRTLRDVSKTWKILRNYIGYTLGERLKSIKAALSPFWQNRPARRTRRQSQRSTGTSSLNLQFDGTFAPNQACSNATTGLSIKIFILLTSYFAIVHVSIQDDRRWSPAALIIHQANEEVKTHRKKIVKEASSMATLSLFGCVAVHPILYECLLRTASKAACVGVGVHCTLAVFGVLEGVCCESLYNVILL